MRACGARSRRRRGSREVHRRECARTVRKALGDACGGRQRLRDVVQRAARLAHQRQDLGGADPLRGRVVGDGLPLRCRGIGPLGGGCVVGDREPAARVRAAMEHEPRAGRIALHEPWLVEEGGTHRAAGVKHAGLDERAHPAPAHRPRRYPAHLHRHRGGLAGLQRRHRAGLPAVGGKVLQQVPDRRAGRGSADPRTSCGPGPSAARPDARAVASARAPRSALPAEGALGREHG